MARAWVAPVVAGCVAGTAAGQEWAHVGPAPTSFLEGSAGRVSAVVCSPTDAEVYWVAGADGGVWKTTDGGGSWTALTDAMPTSAIGALALDPSDEQVIYAGTGEGNYANHSRYGLGVYKSVDGGATWAHYGEETFGGRCFSKIVVSHADPAVVHASITRAGGFPELAAAKGHPGAEGAVGVFTSVDGGVTWARSAGLPDLSATDLVMHPEEAEVLVAGVGRIFGTEQNGVYRSTDGGASWEKLTNGLPEDEDVGRISVAISGDDPDRWWAMITEAATGTGGSASFRGLYRSDDGGDAWTKVNAEVNQATFGWYLSVLSAVPGDASQVIAGGLDLRRVVNNGSFGLTITTPHVDNHAIAWDAAGRLVVGDDGGVHRSDDLGSTWVSLNTNIGTIQFYAGLSTRPDDEEWIIGGAQDNGTNRRSEAGTLWEGVLGGDGGWTQVSPADADVVFAEYQGTGNLTYSPDGGESFFGAGGGINTSDRNAFLPPYVIDGTNPDRALYGTQRVYESLLGGIGGWLPISEDLSDGSGAIRALAIAPTDGEVVYAATNDGNVQVSLDGGRSFELVRDDHPGWPRVTREITVHPEDPVTAYLSVSSFGGERVLRTTDGGGSWESLAGDLPDVPVNVVGVDARFEPAVLYAGTDTGLYRSLNDGASWRRHGTGQPVMVVVDVLVEGDRDRLVVGTQGRGAWVVGAACPADLNGDGVADILDFVAFQGQFASGDLEADCSGDGGLNVLDFICFQERFAEGCE